MYQYPTDRSDYRLIGAGKFYRTRNKPLLGIVLHITAGLQDLGMDGPDGSAEGVAKWAASGSAKVSWHVGVDSDSIVPCLPSTYTAWHATGYNSPTFGIEISKLDVDWSDMPAAWVTATLKNAARALAPIVVENGLPLALRTKAQVDAAIAANDPFGFVYHSSTSAGTRSDPGKNFPFSRLMDFIRAEIDGATTTTTPEDIDMDRTELIKILNETVLTKPDGSTLRRDIGYVRDQLRGDLSRLSATVDAQAAALGALAGSAGVDPADIAAIVDKAVRDRLAQFILTDTGAQS